jgi:hypothetical protein
MKHAFNDEMIRSEFKKSDVNVECGEVVYAGNNDNNGRPSRSISQRLEINPGFDPDGGC